MEVVGICSEPFTSISVRQVQKLCRRAGSKEDGEKGNAAVLIALENQAKRTGLGSRTVVLMHEGQLCFVIPTLATLTGWCQQG